ncbi:endonuclease [Marinilabiliaceae bacterium JC017]|nr:endonuclease [Marinilabiliaceae bacterium JC017]
MKHIIEHFVGCFEVENYHEMPADIITRLNALDRAQRGELKISLFNRAKVLGYNGDGLKAVRWLENSFAEIEKHTFRMHEVLFSPGKDIPENIAFLLDQAKDNIDVCVFTISDRKLSEKVLDAHRRGVKVRIISDDRKTYDQGSQVYGLFKAGISVKIDHSKYHMHHKFGVIDNRIAFSGSYNWTYTASKHNQENLIITTNFDIVRQLGAEFEKLWEEMYVIQ